MKTNEQVKLAAQELSDLHGEGALDFALERVRMLKLSGTGSELDMALRLLTEVEKLTGRR